MQDGGGMITYLTRDHLGSIREQVTRAGTTVRPTSGVRPLGQHDRQWRAPTGWAFTGRENDTETGLYYYRARYYDPTTARFLSEDPGGLRGGLMRYAYVVNSPVRFTDPTGYHIAVHLAATFPPNYYGSPANGTADTSFNSSIGVIGPCCRRGGRWAFDVSVNEVIAVVFASPEAASQPSKESPGMTVEQHEMLHVTDLTVLAGEGALNRRFKTEGFLTEPECNARRGPTRDAILAYLQRVIAWTRDTRDVEHSTAPPPPDLP